MRRGLLAARTLCFREMVRFARQRSRLVGAFGQPLLFWLLLGGGLKASFRPSGSPATGYMQYFYPGIIALTLLFTAIFATISVVEDRKAGFLQGVIVAPVPRWSIVMGQAAGSTLLALLQGVLLLCLAPVIGLRLSVAAVIVSLVVMTLLAFAMSGMGLLLAWKMDSTQGFHAIMNLVLMPMWLLSGAFFPAAGAPLWLRAAMLVNPMTYGMAALRRGLCLGSPAFAAELSALPGMAVSMLLLVLFAAASFSGAAHFARRAAP